jgi:hypothetical protein
MIRAFFDFVKRNDYIFFMLAVALSIISYKLFLAHYLFGGYFAVFVKILVFFEPI